MDKVETQLPRPALILVALIQGLALLILHVTVEEGLWLDQHPAWLYSLYAAALIGPLMLLLSLEQNRQWPKILSWVAPFTLVCTLLGFYTGKQAFAESHLSNQVVWFPLIITLSVATFKALMYIQHRASGQPLQYSFLFLFSWRNFLTFGLALLFTLAVWGILMLWGGLFRAINIRFFMDMFTEPWFYYPILSLANGFGVIIFRNQTRVIDTITRILQALMKFLLVFLVLVSMLFLLALIFTGLSPLWDTGYGSTLILWMQGLLLFFLNAVYQDDPNNRPYPTLIHRFIYVGIALLPIYGVIVFYGLWLRVEQYGWTPARCWGFVLWFFFALFSLGYLWGIIKQRDNWLWHLSWVNVRAGLIVLLVMLLVNSPLLDFRKITIASQLNRLESGAVTAEEFDIRFFRYQLARPGRLALEQLKTELADSNPQVVKEIESLYLSYTEEPQAPSEEEFLSSLTSFGNGAIPPSLETFLYDYTQNNRWRFGIGAENYLVQVDLDSNGQDDYLLLQERYNAIYCTLFFRTIDGWNTVEMGTQAFYSNSNRPLAELLAERKWQLLPNRWQAFDLDGLVFRTQ